VNKDQNLILAGMLHYLLVNNLIHDLITLNSFLLSNANIVDTESGIGWDRGWMGQRGSHFFLNFQPLLLWETAKMCFTVLVLAFTFLFKVKKVFV
jgi:hypothetical protein